MRSTKITSAVAAAVALMAIAPAGAGAVPGHHPLKQGKRSNPGNCSVSMFADPHVVTTGEAAELTGQVSCPGQPAGEQEVTVFEHSAGVPGHHVIGTPKAVAGIYTLSAPGLTTNSVFYAAATGARSPSRAVKVAPLVKVSGPLESVPLLTGRHNLATFHGTTSPTAKGQEWVLQRELSTSTEEWHPIQRGFVGEGGVITVEHDFVVPGSASIRVIVRPRDRFSIRGISNTLSYVISQAENPNLTLESTQDPTAFGQTIMLHGALKAGANQPLTLLSRNRVPGAPFTPVATTTSGTGGAYSFTVAPQANTAYRVSGTGVNSAILFEGVKYVLTATATATTAAAREHVTFSGTVSPIATGHVVYIEREDGFGRGFHVVDGGFVLANGTYSIPHTVHGQGTQVFRVRIPGDPANQAVSSSTTFPINVTPAPGRAPHPVVTPKLPAEGQH